MASLYRFRATRIMATLRDEYWIGSTSGGDGYFVTNKLDLFKNEGVWYDDQVLAGRFTLML